jgi:hypothetical protein
LKLVSVALFAPFGSCKKTRDSGPESLLLWRSFGVGSTPLAIADSAAGTPAPAARPSRRIRFHVCF